MESTKKNGILERKYTISEMKKNMSELKTLWSLQKPESKQ